MFIRFLVTPLIAAGLLAAQNNPGAPPTVNPPFFKGDRKAPDGNTRPVTGSVEDERGEPAEGAVVQVKDTKTLQVRSFLTQADGKYQFAGLNKDVDYELKAQRQGMTSDVKTLSIYDTRREPVINLTLNKKVAEKGKQ
jgi:hypothetical protein